MVRAANGEMYESRRLLQRLNFVFRLQRKRKEQTPEKGDLFSNASSDYKNLAIDEYLFPQNVDIQHDFGVLKANQKYLALKLCSENEDEDVVALAYCILFVPTRNSDAIKG